MNRIVDITPEKNPTAFLRGFSNDDLPRSRPVDPVGAASRADASCVAPRVTHRVGDERSRSFDARPTEMDRRRSHLRTVRGETKLPPGAPAPLMAESHAQ